jgi:hypothetical protein
MCSRFELRLCSTREVVATFASVSRLVIADDPNGPNAAFCFCVRPGDSSRRDTSCFSGFPLEEQEVRPVSRGDVFRTLPVGARSCSTTAKRDRCGGTTRSVRRCNAIGAAVQAQHRAGEAGN